MSFAMLVKNGKEISYHPPVASVWLMLQVHADKNPNHHAITSTDVDTNEYTSITYKHLLELVGQTANFLVSLGVKKGDRFAILMSNTVEILIFELAGGIIGATTVPLDSKRDTLDRKLYKLKDTGAKALFIKNQEKSAEIDTLSKQVKVVQFGNFTEFIQLITKYPNSIPKSLVINLKSYYLILYTSGTTALPKGVAITTQALIANAEGISKWQHLASKDKFNIILPLHHINSTTMSLATILSGGTVVLNSRYSASRFWHIIAKEKCTITSVVPTVLHDLLVRFEEFRQLKLDTTSLKRILIGSAPVLPEETLKFYKTFGIRVVQGYGQTETALRVTGTPVDLNEKEYINTVKTNTIGIELTNCNVAILKKNGKEAKEKEEGEICIRGPVLGDGYLNNSEETKKAFYGGWFHSGDLGYWEYGSVTPIPGIKGPKFRVSQRQVKYFYIIGRLKEIIIKGGINLSPAMIEDALLKNFPEIDEVSVVGYDDVRMGEEVAAVIVPEKSLSLSNLSNLSAFILDSARNNKISGLSSYEVPQKIFIVDSLPKTSTGKIQRVEVKKMVASLCHPERVRWTSDESRDPQQNSKTMRLLYQPEINQLHYFVRQIKPTEKKILTEAVNINNDRWTGLPSTIEEFTARAKNGLLFGAFEETAGLVGSLSCVQLPSSSINSLKTWNEASENGTLSNHDPKGNTIVCIAISVKSSSSLSEQSESKGDMSENKSSTSSDNKFIGLARQKIQNYVHSHTDHVLKFHEKPKGGLDGAIVWKILENGRPDDTEAMGYNIIMKYPDVLNTKKIIHTNPMSPSILLIEHALSYAQKHSVKNIYAFSRPASFRRYLDR